MNTKTLVIGGIAVAIIGAGVFIYLSAQKTSAAIQQAAAGTSNINLLAGQLSAGLSQIGLKSAT